jgi:hypothetical protein
MCRRLGVWAGSRQHIQRNFKYEILYRTRSYLLRCRRVFSVVTTPSRCVTCHKRSHVISSSACRVSFVHHPFVFVTAVNRLSWSLHNRNSACAPPPPPPLAHLSEETLSPTHRFKHRPPPTTHNSCRAATPPRHLTPAPRNTGIRLRRTLRRRPAEGVGRWGGSERVRRNNRLRRRRPAGRSARAAARRRVLRLHVVVCCAAVVFKSINSSVESVPRLSFRDGRRKQRAECVRRFCFFAKYCFDIP